MTVVVIYENYLKFRTLWIVYSVISFILVSVFSPNIEKKWLHSYVRIVKGYSISLLLFLSILFSTATVIYFMFCHNDSGTGTWVITRAGNGVRSTVICWSKRIGVAAVFRWSHFINSCCRVVVVVSGIRISDCRNFKYFGLSSSVLLCFK